MELTRASHRVAQARLLLLLDMERRNVLSVDDALRKEITELQEMLKLEREVRERGDREHKELREKYAEVVGKYGKLKGEFTTLLARTAEMHRDSEQSKAKLQKVETRLSEREQYLTEELRPKDVKMEEFCARLTEHKVSFTQWLVFSSSPKFSAFF